MYELMLMQMVTESPLQDSLQERCPGADSNCLPGPRTPISISSLCFLTMLISPCLLSMYEPMLMQMVTESPFVAGFLTRVLSWRGFQVFTRISYSFYLTQFPVFFYNVGQTRSSEYYTIFQLVSSSFNLEYQYVLFSLEQYYFPNQIQRLF